MAEKDMKEYLITQFSNYDEQVARPYANRIAFDVAKDIGGIKVVDKYQELELTTTQQYINARGAIVGNDVAGCLLASIPVSQGEVYRINGGYNKASRLYALVSNGTVVTVYPSASGDLPQTVETVIVTIPENVDTLIVGSFFNKPLTVERYSKNSALELKSNILYGKKYCACGDSFTDSGISTMVDSEGNTGSSNHEIYDPIRKMYKTYPWWIAERNDMDLVKLAIGGSSISNIEGTENPFSVLTSHYHYDQIPNDCDYVTLAYGLNDCSGGKLTANNIGSKNDTENTTFWGAYNIVLESILTNNPSVKLGIIINDGWMSQLCHDTQIDIAKYWGVPYLDLRDDEHIGMLTNGVLREHSSVAQNLRDSAFRLDNLHPSLIGQKYRSTIIENFLRSL